MIWLAWIVGGLIAWGVVIALPIALVIGRAIALADKKEERNATKSKGVRRGDVLRFPRMDRA